VTGFNSYRKLFVMDFRVKTSIRFWCAIRKM